MTHIARYEKGVSDTLALLFPIKCHYGDGRDAVTSKRIGDSFPLTEIDVCEEHR